MQKKWISADEPKLYHHSIGKYIEFKWKLAKLAKKNQLFSAVEIRDVVDIK